MTSVNPIFSNVASTAATTSAANSSQNSRSSTLGPNSFITLLTAQLQAQDPLSPMDPNQMVTELTSMNTLQQTIQIRQDLDAIVNSLSPPQGSGSPAGIGVGGSRLSTNSATVPSGTTANAAALSALSVMAALPASNPAANTFFQTSPNSQLF